MDINTELLGTVAPNAVNGRARQNVKRVASEKVQGEGSWVVVKAVTLGESKRLLAESQSSDQAAQLAMSEQLIRDKLVDWNWLDDDGQPLPLPVHDPNVLDLLTGEEILFLGAAIRGDIDPK